MSNFKKGDRVVCINDNWDRDVTIPSSHPAPKKGDLLTINWVGDVYNKLFVGFEEMSQEDCFFSYHFEKVRDHLSTTASKELAYKLFEERIGKKTEKYLPEEKEIVLTEDF